MLYERCWSCELGGEEEMGSELVWDERCISDECIWIQGTKRSVYALSRDTDAGRKQD